MSSQRDQASAQWPLLKFLACKYAKVVLPNMFSANECLSKPSCSHVFDVCVEPLKVSKKAPVPSFFSWLKQKWDSFECTTVKSSLKRHRSAWEALGAHPFLCNIVASGYRIPFINYPTPCHRPNNSSAVKDPEFVLHSLYNFGSLPCQRCPVVDFYTLPYLRSCVFLMPAPQVVPLL